MRWLYLFILAFFVTACLPLQIAPKLEEGKVVKGQKFKKQLPERYAFVFGDPKNADEFYMYINTIYQLNNKNVTDNVPVIIEEKNYFISFYETEKTSKTVNLIPLAINLASYDGTLVDTKALSDASLNRKGKWYIALTVNDADYKDALAPNYPERIKIQEYITSLHQDYINNDNYYEVLLRD